MRDPRLTAPVFPPDVPRVGPPSYFPSIEKKYGKPIQYWIDLAAERIVAGDRHSDAVEWLKAEHGLGHGHASSVVGWVREQLSA